jgi:hypothetical protein
MKYLYANSQGLFSNLNPLMLIDTKEKREVVLYSLLSYGFIPLLSPLYLLPVAGDLTTYFVLANHLPGAQGIFGHYRITLTPFLILATISAVSSFKLLNKWYISLYLIFFTLLVQYLLHLPLSYLTKNWFWLEPSGVKNINYIIKNYLPTSASVVAQNNIVPHISHRVAIYSLYPEKKVFLKESPCGKNTCNWFRWHDNPQYLFIDMSPDWDARHLLEDREKFIDGIHNLERKNVITKYVQYGSTILYKVNKNPSEIN